MDFEPENAASITQMGDGEASAWEAPTDGGHLNPLSFLIISVVVALLCSLSLLLLGAGWLLALCMYPVVGTASFFVVAVLMSREEGHDFDTDPGRTTRSMPAAPI